VSEFEVGIILHLSTAVSAEECKRALTLQLGNSDFEEALNKSVPLLQRGVELFHGSVHSWDDIGGLSEVKKILIEVLQWPSQVSMSLSSLFCENAVLSLKLLSYF
jgi:peroxin-1